MDRDTDATRHDLEGTTTTKKRIRNKFVYREWYLANKDRIQRKQREWRLRNIAHAREYDRNYYRSTGRKMSGHGPINPEKHRVRVMLKNAVKLGHIIRPEFCSKCGKTCTPHGHHPDYSKPFDVVWLCSECHGKEHRKPIPTQAEILALLDTI